MPVLGIQNFDALTKRVYLMEKACSAKVLDEALAAAGDVLADALVAATPIGSQGHKTYKRKGEYRPAGNARRSVINVSARSKKYGITRRLIGYSKDAFYMLWVVKGHQMVTGGKRGKPGSGRLPRKASAVTNTHSQSGQGKVVGYVSGRNFMNRVFRSKIKLALAAARSVIARAVKDQSASGRAA